MEQYIKKSRESAVTISDQLQNYFTAIDSDKIDYLVDEVFGIKQKKIARAIIEEVPNLINTDIYSLKILVELLSDIDFLNTKMREAQKNNNLMLYSKLLKSKLDCISKVNSILNEFGLTPVSRKKIMVLDMEEII